MADSELIDPNAPAPKPDDPIAPRWLTGEAMEALIELAKQRPLNARDSTMLSASIDLRDPDPAVRARARQIIVACESQNQSDQHLQAKGGRGFGGADQPRVVIRLPFNGRGRGPGTYDDPASNVTMIITEGNGGD